MTLFAKLYLTWLGLVKLFHNFNDAILPPPPEIANLEFPGLANKYGYQPLRHEVTTEDGYILTLFHIPGRSTTPVLLVPGIADTSDTWLLRGEESLGVTLLKEGYDVWFANSRGNRYSRCHVSLDPDNDAAYWNFSFHHMGYYDLPAIIDKILNETQAASLTAMGHSRGNLMFYILGATRPEYNSKVNLMVALAPICHQHNIKPPISTLFHLAPMADRLFKKFDIRITEVLGYNSTLTKMMRDYCTFPEGGPERCLNNIMFALAGYDPEEVEQSFVSVFIHHFPAGTSWMDLMHLSQLNRPDFSQFDYGTDQNLVIYNASIPPVYNLTLATMPFALLAGRNDRLSSLQNVDLLRSQLPNVVDYTINQRPLFNHLDDIWGRHMTVYLFPDIFRVLRQYNQV